MGFDIYIEASVLICQETGKPYYQKYDAETKKYEIVYGIPIFEVPEEMRKYLRQRGHHFSAYTRIIEQAGDGTKVHVGTFLDAYPSWEDVEDSLDDSDWTENDHEEFRQLLMWCVEQECSFNVSWSY